jgi:hypothetical protein
MRTRSSIAIHHEDRSEDSLISEDHFVHFADIHERMKKNKGKKFVVRIPKRRSRWKLRRSIIFGDWVTAWRPFRPTLQRVTHESRAAGAVRAHAISIRSTRKVFSAAPESEVATVADAEKSTSGCRTLIALRQL